MAKISKKTIESLREFLDRGCDYAGTQETVTEIANEALRENGCELCQCDDASVCDWDGDEVCTVEDFANVFWDKAVEKILNVLAQVNQLRPVIERAKQRMREGKENGSVLD